MTQEKEREEFVICIESYMLGMLEASKFSSQITGNCLNTFKDQACAIELQLINFRTTGGIDRNIGITGGIDRNIGVKNED